MGMYKYIKQTWKKPEKETLRNKMVEWRKQPVTQKIKKPTRLDRARALGYKAKKGFIIARVRILRGGRKRTRPKKGRRTKNLSIRKVLKMNYKWIAEKRADKKFPNLEVLNSYKLGKDGKNYFFEVILIDPSKPEIANSMPWITKKKNQKRTQRGLTSAGKKSRGLRKKSPENKNRPSIRAGKRKGK